MREERLKRIRKIVEEADLAFWSKVADLVPEATSGDLDPERTVQLKIAMENAVEAWMHYNVPDAGVMVYQLASLETLASVLEDDDESKPRLMKMAGELRERLSELGQLPDVTFEDTEEGWRVYHGNLD